MPDKKNGIVQDYGEEQEMIGARTGRGASMTCMEMIGMHRPWPKRIGGPADGGGFWPGCCWLVGPWLGVPLG